MGWERMFYSSYKKGGHSHGVCEEDEIGGYGVTGI
jgi:hypothetical protein